MTKAEIVPVEQVDERLFSIDERDDDMLIAARHWQFGWRCIARRPKLMTNEQWRPEAELIIAALTAQSARPPEGDEVEVVRKPDDPGEPLSEADCLRELGLLYNYRDTDEPQFTRWNMVVAIEHGRRLASDEAARAAIEASLPFRDGGWRPIETAPKDGTRILVVLGAVDNEQIGHLAGRVFDVRHEGVTASGYDLGWSLYPGYGGVPDRWLAGWRPLPDPPVVRQRDEG
jgi:hypothetical protein